MKFATFISLLTCTSAAVASTTPLRGKNDKHQGRCLPRHELESILPKYIQTYGGITDGGKQAREIFQEDIKTYSQSLWWVIGRPDAVEAHSEVSLPFYGPPLDDFRFPVWNANLEGIKKDDFPPFSTNLEEIIKQQTKEKNNPEQFIPGPVIYGCNTFAFYWKGDLSVPGIPSKGRVNGIDIAFVNPETGKVYEIYTEFNTLAEAYGWGAHITWSENPTCCECPVPFDPTCKCPTA